MSMSILVIGSGSREIGEQAWLSFYGDACQCYRVSSQTYFPIECEWGRVSVCSRNPLHHFVFTVRLPTNNLESSFFFRHRPRLRSQNRNLNRDRNCRGRGVYGAHDSISISIQNHCSMRNGTAGTVVETLSQQISLPHRPHRPLNDPLRVHHFISLIQLNSHTLSFSIS